MKFVLHTGCVSPHVLPYAKILADKIGHDNFRYLYEDPMSQDRLDMGWGNRVTEWTVESWKHPKLAQELLQNAECLYTGCREVEVFEARAQKGLKTFYGAERWFKPITLFDLRLFDCLICVQVPGWVRMLVPSYRKMAKRFVRWIQNDPNGRVFAIGPWAKKDMLRLGVPESKIVPWGYFVSPSSREKVLSFKMLAERKVEEWLAGVTRESFLGALRRLVEEKAAVNEYRFKRSEERELALEGAIRFFDEYSRKIVMLSDGRCVYFAPDSRSKVRNGGDLPRCWAEYAFHAVSNGGRRVAGKEYNERWYHPHKAANFGRLDETLIGEKCFVRLRDNAQNDSILFCGEVASGLSFDVVTRLDEYGNMDANLTEVTFEVTTRREKKLPRLVPLTEAVQAVVHHQTTAGSYPSDKDTISNSPSLRNALQDGAVLSNNRTIKQSNNLKVLWVGRMLHLKRVDTIIRAVCEVEKRGRDGQRTIQFTLVGDGPEKPCLQRFATQTHKLSNPQAFKPSITFLPSQPIDKIRDIMREHDVFVFASNAIEGWGAVVSEALEEGMTVIGTYEAGSSITILSDEWLFRAGDWRRLSKLLVRCVEMKAAGTLQGQGIGEWSAQKAAERLLGLIA